MSDLKRDLRPSRTSRNKDGHFSELSGESETAGAIKFGFTFLLLEVPHDLRANPFPYRDRDAIADHAVSMIIAPRESE